MLRLPCRERGSVRLSSIGCIRSTRPLAGLCGFTTPLRRRRIFALRCIYVPLVWFWSFTLPGVLRAADDNRLTSLISIISMRIFRLGFIELLGFRLSWGAVGIWRAMFLDWATRETIFEIRFFLGKNPAFMEAVSHEAV